MSLGERNKGELVDIALNADYHHIVFDKADMNTHSCRFFDTVQLNCEKWIALKTRSITVQSFPNRFL